MTFKKQYKEAMDGVVPSEDFSERLKKALAEETAGEKNTPDRKKTGFISGYRKHSAVRKVVAGVLSAACIVVIAGVVIHAMKTAGNDFTGENMMMAPDLSSSYAAESAEGEEEETVGACAPETAPGPSEDAFPEEGAGSADAESKQQYTYGFSAGAADGAALNTYVEQVSAEAIAVERNDGSKSETDGGDDWVLLCVSSEDVEAFAETLYNSVAYSMVEEIESSLAGASDPSDPVYELCLKLSDGSSLRLAVSESGVIVVEDLHMIVYMACGNEAFLKVWNACVDVQ